MNTKKAGIFRQDVFFIIVLSCLLNTAFAETLEDAWLAAISNSHQLKAAQVDSSVFEAELKGAQGQQLPKLKINTGYSQLSETPAALAQFAGQNIQFNTSQSNSVNAQAMVSVPIFSSGRISHGINAAEANWQASQANETTALLNMKLQVSEAYIAVLRAESALKVGLSHIDSLKAHALDVHNRFKEGMVARNDMLAANVELINAEQATEQVRTSLATAKARYNQLLGRNLEQSVSLESRFPETPKGMSNELGEMALKHRPELTAMPEQMQALAEEAQSVKAQLLPQVSLKGGYSYQQNRYQAFEGMWMATIGVDWQLFDGSSNHHSDALTRKSLALKEQYADLINQINLQVYKAWLTTQETRKRIAVTQQAIAQADENEKVTTDLYQQGFTINTEVLRSEELRVSTQNNFNNATYDAALASLRLRWAMGIL